MENSVSVTCYLFDFGANLKANSK